MLTIDGSFGEGGGQILRSSLALSIETGRAIRIENIRAGRKKPGLLRQHLTAVNAAMEVCGGNAEGAAMRSEALTFEPGKVKGGEYSFAVGTAGSATLVLQTVLPALMTADEPSHLTLHGGTHNPWAPPVDFIERALVPLLNRMGPEITVKLIRPGFYPAGGGEFVVTIEPVSQLARLDILERGEVIARRATAMVARLSGDIAIRELRKVKQKLGWSEDELHVEARRDSAGPGNVVLLEIESENVTEVFTGFGQVEVPAKAVAGHAVQQVQKYLGAGVPIGPYLTDQLLVPMALAGGRFRTTGLTRHARTNIDLIQQFLNVDITTEKLEGKVCEVRVEPDNKKDAES
ncbi:MAG: RNA 3'-terminal phosphate cyclase [bacterium]|nr:RNA 3'-terminal phosphate cyclase [bacterium]